MGQFLEDIEAAKMLNMGIEHLEQMEIHKCPYGYSTDVLEEYIARNGIPLKEEIYHTLTIGHETSQTIACDSLTEALYKANPRTYAIISDKAFPEDVYDLAVKNGLKLFYVGQDCEHCHMSFASFRDAIDMASFA